MYLALYDLLFLKYQYIICSLKFDIIKLFIKLITTLCKSANIRLLRPLSINNQKALFTVRLVCLLN